MGSERITKDFLSSILEEPIEEINLDENIVLRREYLKGKMGVVDVLAKINEKEYCHIEMQVGEANHIKERLLYYWSRRYAKTIKESEEYQSLKRTISILITDFEVKGLEDLRMHSKWKIIEENGKKHVLTDDLELHIIELPKIKKMQETKENSKLLKWLKFLENPESEEVEIYMKENVNMKEARTKLEGISEDARMQRIAELREKAILDEKEAEYTGYIKGVEDGKKDGKKEGKEDEKLTIAKKMKEENMDISLIVKITGLSKETIDSL